MDIQHPIKVIDLARRWEAALHGRHDLLVTGLNEIHKVRPGDLMFVDHPKYYSRALASAATVILMDRLTDVPEGKAVLIHPRPFECYDSLMREYRAPVALSASIHPTAEVHPSAIVEPGVTLGPHVTIGAESHLQAGCYLGAYTQVGRRVIIQPGAMIGTDAFYYKKTDDGYTKWCTGGRVIIRDEVEIGAACTIARGVSGDTIIGAGSKLDCQVHLGHGVVVGERCLIAAQAGIAGKTIIGDDCVIYGQAGLAQGLTVGAKAVISAQSGVSKSLAGDAVYAGTPATEIRQQYRELAALRRLVRGK